jgi:alkaline phosphatase D
MLALLGLLSLFAVGRCSPEIYDRNLAYRSPYTEHPALSVDTRQVYKRHAAASDNIKRGLSKRADYINVPAGEFNEYSKPAYSFGVTDWTTSDHVYAGNLNFTHSVASGELTGALWRKGQS